jgi:hypothetical protein
MDNKSEETPMVRMITKEHQHSQPEVREVPYAHAYAMGTRGSCYSVIAEDIKTGALIDEWKVMDLGF